MPDNYMKAMENSSFLAGGNSAYLEALYEDYLKDPSSVEGPWRDYFDNLTKTNASKDASMEAVRERFLEIGKSKQKIAAFQSSDSSTSTRALEIINAYRSHGHHQADLDPLQLSKRQDVEDLHLSHFHISKADLQQTFDASTLDLPFAKSSVTLSEIYQVMKEVYCRSIGIEYMHISDGKETTWLQNRLEKNRGRFDFTADEKKNMFNCLVAAEGLEKYLARRFVGQKRFSLEGSDSLIPLLRDMVQGAGHSDVKEMVIGMAHRGRLNVMVNVLGKPPKVLFDEFQGIHSAHDRSGDVKYHLGFSSDIPMNGHALHLTLGFNPSHLEIISPVIEGSVRARQDKRQDKDRGVVVPVVIHGDAAFAGQGVVMETFNMSQARGYKTGGTVHIIINNQIGFTTSNPLDSRSTLYCTDVAKMVQAPVIHVNGDDPEAVIFAGRLALDYRMTFKKDIVLDLVTYRRLGHNEADEPAITQPVMYNKIRQHPTVVTLYGNKLQAEGVMSEKEIQDAIESYSNALDKGDSVVQLALENPEHLKHVDWSPYLGKEWTAPYENSLTTKALQNLGKKMLTVPAGFALQKQVEREMEARQEMNEGKAPLFWGFAENLAYATLLDEGYSVRISGQDCGRGTFTHRHAVLHDFNTGDTYTPLEHISNKGKFTIIDSILSEEAVLGFEYGFASASPETLVIWEAQFGDFVNGAQVVIDQFISSADQKWGRLCGLALFLPHGYEGMGPEHSSARLERFLQLCAQHNMQVCVPSTPAQCFHMIRRQMIREFRKPLIVMTPKSLLRNKMATSTYEELVNGTFQTVIPEIDDIPAAGVKRLILCSGKVYYDLLQKRREDNRKDVAIVRIEQLYPFPEEALKKILAQYKLKDIVWCQEEPENQGAWYSTQHHIRACLGKNDVLYYAGRPASASPAVGYLAVHIEEQHALVLQAFSPKP